MAAPIKNAEQVKQILTETLQKKPEMYAHFVNYVLVDAYTKLGQLASAVARIKQQQDQFIAMIQAAQAQQPAPGQEAQVAQPAQPQIKLPPGMQLPGVTMPVAVPQAQPTQDGGGGRAPANGLPPGFTGNSPSGAKYVNGVRMSQLDGTPLSPEEQEIEERMDAATS